MKKPLTKKQKKSSRARMDSFSSWNDSNVRKKGLGMKRIKGRAAQTVRRSGGRGE